MQHSAYTTQDTRTVTLLARLLTFGAETECSSTSGELQNWLPGRLTHQQTLKEALLSPRDVSRNCWATRSVNPLTPNDPYSGRTAPLTSKRYILYIYSTNIGTECFKHDIYSQFFLFKMQFHNSNVFGSCIIHILYTGCAKIKKIIPA